MITIKGKNAEAIIYSSEIDNSSKGFITALCNSVIAKGSKIRIMPDVHPSKGCTVGMTMTLQDIVAPGLIGNDIGCGMYVVKLKAKKVELQKLDKLINANIPVGVESRKNLHRFYDKINLSMLRCAKHIRINKAFYNIGTLGGGNHFIEMDKCGEWYYLVIHSGSRHLGVEVERYYHELAYQNMRDNTPYEFAYLNGQLMADYLHDIKIVQEFAKVNREAMADEIVKNMKFVVFEDFHTIHNYIDVENMILRKGAISAKAGEQVVIPLNMRDGCLLCLGKGNDDWNQSAPHGAGRIYSRSDTLNSFTLSQYKKEMKNVYSTTIIRETLDECPMAYKNSQSIVDAIIPTVEVVEHIKPIYNFKAGRR